MTTPTLPATQTRLSSSPLTTKRVEPETFKNSRLLDFCSEKELTAQTGHRRNEWPLVILKELVDNALDACETAGITPVITVTVDAKSIQIADNGRGIPASTIAGACDFASRTSSCAAYVGLTRGAQGNALQTILAMPYVESGDAGRGQAIIEAGGQRHTIEIAADLVRQEPVVTTTVAPSDVKIGTSVRVVWALSASSESGDENPIKDDFLQLAAAYGWFNPHLALTVDWFGERLVAVQPTNRAWKKWRPSDPTSPHWYAPETLKTLIANCLRKDQDNGTSRTVREFIKDFDGLTSTAKQAQVLDATQLSKSPLSRLVVDRDFDTALVKSLLAAMRTASRPVKPAALGLIGKEHLHTRFEAAGCDMDTFEYRKVLLDHPEDLPTIVEVAFAYNGEDSEDYAGTLLAGTKWSPAIRNPFRDLGAHGSLDGILSNQYADEDEPVTVFVHVAQPLSSFTDRGKSAVVVPEATANAIVGAVTRVTERWTKQRKREEREAAARAKRAAAVARRRAGIVSLTTAAAMVMEEAYLKASANGTLPAHARQIMYAARPQIQVLSGKPLDDAYFTQNLLPNYMAEHDCSRWRIAYDARGHFHEPHTNREVPLGTLAVDEYLERVDEHTVLPPQYDVRERLYPTCGSKHRFGAILFVEKEGFMPLFEAVSLRERYDIATMSTKGMSNTASRRFVDEQCGDGVPLLVLHDFDKSGFSIVGTLMRDTRRYEFENNITVIDLGLRIGDIADLEHEASGLNPKEYESCRQNLAGNGATPEEIEFLLRRRVELNAFTSDGLVDWIEAKLAEHGISKVIPDDETLADAFRRARENADVQARIEKVVKRWRRQPPQIVIPPDLRKRVQRALHDNPRCAWDEVIRTLVR